jgi:hypothetical protein
MIFALMVLLQNRGSDSQSFLNGCSLWAYSRAGNRLIQLHFSLHFVISMKKAIEHSEWKPNMPIEYTLEDYAFSSMLNSHVDKERRADGHIYFHLYGLESIGMSCESLISEFEDGGRYLCIDCL